MKALLLFSLAVMGMVITSYLAGLTLGERQERRAATAHIQAVQEMARKEVSIARQVAAIAESAAADSMIQREMLREQRDRYGAALDRVWMNNDGELRIIPACTEEQARILGWDRAGNWLRGFVIRE